MEGKSFRKGIKNKLTKIKEIINDNN